MKNAPIIAQIATLFIFFFTTCFANAQSINPSLDDKFQLRLGPFLADFETNIDILDSPFARKQFGGQETTVAAFSKWRITPKFHFNLGYSGISREGSNTLDSDLTIGSLTVPAGTGFFQSSETSSLPITLAYAFVKNPKTEFGADVGISVTSIKNRIDFTVPDVSTITLIDQSITEPLPTIGLFWNQAFSSKWMLAARFGYTGIEIGGLDGNFYGAHVNIEFRPWSHVGIGASYLYNSADGVISSDGVVTEFDYQYSGPFMYLQFGWGAQ